VDATSVYFVDSAQKMVLRVPREGLADGGAPEGVSPPPGYDPTTYDVTGGQAPIAMDRDRIYWATGYGGGSIFVPGRMQSAPKTGVPDGGTSTSYAYHWIGVVGIGVDDTNIYWADTRNAIAFQAKSDGMDAGAIVTIADGQRDVRGLWITADRVYWANTSTGTILAAPKTADAGAPTVFASGQNRPTAIASDDVALYWANEGGDAVLSCPLSGCVGVARIIAGDQATPSSVAVDTGAIYWANTGDGTIMKVAK
jgi:hypothetical protein